MVGPMIREMAELVFVYGTLKRGLALAREMRRARGKLLGLATIRGNLYDLGPYPAAVPGRGTIHGELYAVPEPGLAHLDRVEGRGYRRRLVTALGLDGWKRKAWVYFYRRRPAHAPRLPEGRYAGEE